MKTICAYCKKEISDNHLPAPKGVPANAVSHGICERCEVKVIAEIEKLEKEKANEKTVAR